MNIHKHQQQANNYQPASHVSMVTTASTTQQQMQLRGDHKAQEMRPSSQTKNLSLLQSSKQKEPTGSIAPFDDTLHCESIEEEIIQPVRGSTNGQALVASVLGRATAYADSEDAEVKRKGKSSSIIVMSQQQNQVVASSSKTAKKTTASQNKFDIKAIVAAGQEGCYSRKSNVPSSGISVGYRERSNPTSGFQTIQIIGPSIQPNSITKLSKESINKSAANPVSNGSGVVFASFFSQPREQVDFLTKTLGCTPQAQQERVSVLAAKIAAPATVKQTQKKGADILIGGTALKERQQSNEVKANISAQQKANPTKALYKSFQGPAQPQHNRAQTLIINQQQQHAQAPANGVSNLNMMNTLKTFTQNYYGAQHEKNKKRQPHQVGGNGKVMHKGSQSNTISHNPSSSMGLVVPNSNDVQHSSFVVNNQSSRQQLKFGQIMEELERFSLSNMGTHPEDRFEDTAQSSICESDLEYTNLGNIRASTYKRTQETQAQRMIKKQQRKYHKSEERKREPSFFSHEYMNSRYINDRVEMELKDFKAEIEKKFETSKLREFKFPLQQKRAHQRGHSVEDHQPKGPLAAIHQQHQQVQQRITLGGKNVIFKTHAAPLKPTPGHAKSKTATGSILDDSFPVEITKTHQDHRQQINIKYNITGGIQEVPSYSDSLNDVEYQDKKVLFQNFVKQENRAGLQNLAAKNHTATKQTSKQTKGGSNPPPSDPRGNYINFNQFDTSIAMINEHDQYRASHNQSIVLQNVAPEREYQSEAQAKKAQKQTPKNYSLQLNQVVKKILNDSGQAAAEAPKAKGTGKALNSTSFDQMMYEPSFYTTESYKQQMGAHNASIHPHQVMYFTKDYAAEKHRGGHQPVLAEDEDAPQDELLQSYTNTSEGRKKQQQQRTGTSTKKSSLKVKRSDSNGSQTNKSTLLNKIYRSSKTIKSPQSRQSNMNLNNQNPLNHQPIKQVGVKFNMKPSATVNNSNVHSTLSSVRQFQIQNIQNPGGKQQTRHGSSGLRGSKQVSLSIGAGQQLQFQKSRVPSTSNKNVPEGPQNLSVIGSNNFQTEVSNSHRGGPKAQVMIRKTQAKRTSGERSGRDGSHKYKKDMLSKQPTSGGELSIQQPLIDSASQFALMQRSFHNNHLSVGNAAALTAAKGSVAASPKIQQRTQKPKSQSLTSKSTQRGGGPSHEGKIVNFGILNQMSNPQSNGKGGKITYRNNFQRMGSQVEHIAQSNLQFQIIQSSKIVGANTSAERGSHPQHLKNNMMRDGQSIEKHHHPKEY